MSCIPSIFFLKFVHFDFLSESDLDILCIIVDVRFLIISCFFVVRSMKHPTIPKEPKFHVPQQKKIKSCLSWNDIGSYTYQEWSSKKTRKNLILFLLSPVILITNNHALSISFPTCFWFSFYSCIWIWMKQLV